VHEKLYLKVFIFSKNLKIKIFKTIILPVVLYGYEAWSLILTVEFRMKVHSMIRDWYL
jgi:hypothetical protein